MKARLATYRDGKLQETYPLPEPGTTIGRDEENHICLDHALVSRRHAAIKAKDDMWVIKDLDSTNGIEVNGAPIKYAVLKNADVIVIGPFCLVFETAPESAEWGPARSETIPTAKRPSAPADAPAPKPSPATMPLPGPRVKPPAAEG